MRLSDNLLTKEQWLGKLLSDLGIGRLEYRMSGSGDSGDIDSIDVFPADGQNYIESEDLIDRMRQVKAPGKYGIEDLAAVMSHYAEEAVSQNGNWYDNEGGQGGVDLIVVNGELQEESSWVEAWPEEDDPDYDDDDDFDDEDEDYEVDVFLSP